MRPPEMAEAGNVPPCCDPTAYAYFLDFDGTLVEIAEHPDHVDADFHLLRLLQDLHEAAGGALAIISGRPIEQIDALFHPVKLAVAGQHGAERRDAFGVLHRHRLETGPLEALRVAADHWQRAHPGLMVEDKGLSIAFHFRQDPALAAPLHRLLHEHLTGFEGSFQLQTGKMVVEVKPAGLDKGRAIREFLTEPPFRGREAVFIGDDDTDEYGFAEVNSLGGVSAKVGSGPSNAAWRFDDVSAVRVWLQHILTCAERRPL
ncbi:MAG: trehalose-phosphatase [Methylotetracoccus sp.]|nr:trehalose-phosphatase [Methylotetracoccus sp.]